MIQLPLAFLPPNSVSTVFAWRQFCSCRLDSAEPVEGISMATCRRNSAGFPHRIRSFLLRRGAVWAIQQSVVQPCAALWCTVYLCGMYFRYTWWQPAHVCNHNRFFRFRLRVLYWPAGQQVSCFQHAQRPTCLAVGRQANPCVACLRKTCIKRTARSVPQVFHTHTNACCITFCGIHPSTSLSLFFDHCFIFGLIKTGIPSNLLRVTIELTTMSTNVNVIVAASELLEEPGLRMSCSRVWIWLSWVNVVRMCNLPTFRSLFAFPLFCLQDAFPGEYGSLAASTANSAFLQWETLNSFAQSAI